LNASQTQELGARYMRAHSFDIHYFPRDNANEEAHDMAEKLYDALEWIEYDDVLYQGRGMNHEIVDGVLHFFVDYAFRVRRVVPEPPKMDSMEQEGYLK